MALFKYDTFSQLKFNKNPQFVNILNCLETFIFRAEFEGLFVSTGIMSMVEDG